MYEITKFQYQESFKGNTWTNREDTSMQREQLGAEGPDVGKGRALGLVLTSTWTWTLILEGAELLDSY